MPGWAHYWEEPSALADFTVSPVGVGVRARKSRAILDRTLPSIAVVLVTRGRGWLSFEDGPRMPVVAPALLWLPAGRAHSYAPDGESWDEQWVLIGGVGARLYADRVGFAPERELMPVGPTTVERIAWLIAQLRETGAVPGRAALLRSSVLMQRILVIIGDAADEPGADRDRHLLERVAADAIQPLAVAERARRVGLSLEQLRALTRRTSGQSPQSVVEGVRVSRAMQLLAETDLSVQQVGRRVGYDDAAYFSRVFRDRVGVAPSRYRDRAR